MPDSHERIDAHLEENSQLPQPKRAQSSEQTAAQVEETFQSTLSQEVYNQILTYMHSIDKNKDFYSEGYNGRIYVVDVALEQGDHKKFIVIKCRKNTLENEKLIFEYYNHIKMYKFAKKMNSPIISVPKVYGIKNDDDGEMYLIMDFIEGMTLYTYKLSKVLPIIYQHLAAEMGTAEALEKLGPIEEYTECKTDKDTKQKIELLLNIFKRYPENEFYDKYLADFSLHSIQGTFMEQKQARIFDRLCDDFNLGSLAPSTVESIQDTLLEYLSKMHNEGLYHNDVTHRNIILGEDGKIYIIDFDKAGTERQKPAQARLFQNEKHTQQYKGKRLEGDFRIIGDIESLKMK